METMVKEAIQREDFEQVDSGIILLSGGLDSAVTAWCAKEECKKLYALSFDYGQTHIKEKNSAKLLADRLETIEHKILKLPLSELGGSSLFNKDEIPSKGVLSGIPSTWVPQRNAVFLAIAFSWAEVVGADRVYIGVNAVDYSGYPDCRPEFIKAYNRALNLASKQFVETGRGVSVSTPIIDLTKKQIIELGLRLGVPFELTWSCYKGENRPCGVCDSCRIRLAAFKELGIVDPGL